MRFPCPSFSTAIDTSLLAEFDYGITERLAATEAVPFVFAKYSAGFADLFFSVEPYVWGRDTHDGIAYTVGSTWYFDFSRPAP